MNNWRVFRVVSAISNGGIIVTSLQDITGSHHIWSRSFKNFVMRLLDGNFFFFSEWLVSLAGNGKSGDGRTDLLQELTFEF